MITQRVPESRGMRQCMLVIHGIRGPLWLKCWPATDTVTEERDLACAKGSEPCHPCHGLRSGPIPFLTVVAGSM